MKKKLLLLFCILFYTLHLGPLFAGESDSEEDSSPLTIEEARKRRRRHTFNYGRSFSLIDTRNKRAKKCGLESGHELQISEALLEIHGKETVFGNMEELEQVLRETEIALTEEDPLTLDRVIPRLIKLSENLNTYIKKLNELKRKVEADKSPPLLLKPVKFFLKKLGDGAVLSIQVVTRLSMALNNFLEKLSEASDIEIQLGAFEEVCYMFVKNLTFLESADVEILKTVREISGQSINQLLSVPEGLTVNFASFPKSWAFPEELMLRLSNYSAYSLVTDPFKSKVFRNERFKESPLLLKAAKQCVPSRRRPRNQRQGAMVIPEEYLISPSTERSDVEPSIEED